MKRPYLAVVWKHDGWHAFQRKELGSFRTHERAKRAVEAWLMAHPVETTRGCYHRDVARGPHGEVRNAKRPDLCGESIDAPVLIVPSVGELLLKGLERLSLQIKGYKHERGVKD